VFPTFDRLLLLALFMGTHDSLLLEAMVDAIPPGREVAVA